MYCVTNTSATSKAHVRSSTEPVH